MESSKLSLAIKSAVVLLLLYNMVPTAPAENTPNLQSLGLLLGVPVTTDVGPKRKTPTFLQDVYQCWNSGRGNCMPQGASGDVNVVRSILGTVRNSAPKAYRSYNQRELNNSISIVFNMSFNSVLQPEKVRYATFHIYKQALSLQQKDALKQSKCDNSLSLQLYTVADEDGQEVAKLRQTTPLNLDSDTPLDGTWFTFPDITDVYTTQYNLLINKTSNHHIFSLRVAISGSVDCTSSDLPSLLGFSSVPGYEPQLIGYAKNDLQEGAISSRLLAEIGRQHTNRQRRQTDVELGSGTKDDLGNTTEADSTTFPPINVTRPTSRPPQTLDEIKLAKCRLYRHNISFIELGWDQYIIEPLSYEANFCAGRCEWPLRQEDNTTKHSYIQGVASFNNPDLIPTPCCAPVPQKLSNLTVVLQDSEDNVVVRKWTDMIANSCGCL